MKVELKVQNMHCEHCEKRVKRALEALGIEVAEVNAKKELVVFVQKEGDSLEQIIEAIEDVGYDVVQ